MNRNDIESNFDKTPKHGIYFYFVKIPDRLLKILQKCFLYIAHIRAKAAHAGTTSGASSLKFGLSLYLHASKRSEMALASLHIFTGSPNTSLQ